MNTDQIQKQIRMLQRAGYIVINLRPAMWRARGEFGYVDFWLSDGLHRNQGEHDRAIPYQDAVLTARACQQPYEVPTMEEQHAHLAWKDRLEHLVFRYPQMYLAT